MNRRINRPFRPYGVLLVGLICLTFSSVYAGAADNYKLGPDSEYHPGVPRGTVTHYTWSSKIYPGTMRDYWVYVPQQYDPKTPACVMIFQDGGGFQDTGGGFRIPIVFDNLIAAKQMPVTIGICIDPGIVPPAGPDALPRYNRSFEYDSPNDRYARFLLKEILPEVGKSYNLTNEANGRALCGASSGGICAFVAAWERPDKFSRVLSFVGSFTHLKGGHDLAPLIRKMEPRPIRVFLQDGTNDQDIYGGSWYLGNQEVASALKFAGYDVRFVVGDGGHSGVHGRAILPDALRWLWRDYPAPVHAATTSRQPVMNHIVTGEGWQRVQEIDTATSLATDPDGAVYVSDLRGARIYRIGPSGIVKVWKEKVPGIAAISFGPDGRMYAAIPGQKRIVTLDAAGKQRIVASSVVVDVLVVGHNGGIYYGERGSGNLEMVDSTGHRSIVDTGVPAITGMTLTPDQSLLIVGQDVVGKDALSYRILADGKLTAKQEYFDIYMPYGRTTSGSGGMATDTQGWLYVASTGGVQILDQAGRVNGMLSNPKYQATTGLTFGGENQDTLYVIAGNGVFRRKLKVKAVFPFQDPIRPPGPHL